MFAGTLAVCALILAYAQSGSRQPVPGAERGPETPRTLSTSPLRSSGTTPASPSSTLPAVDDPEVRGSAKPAADPSRVSTPSPQGDPAERFPVVVEKESPVPGSNEVRRHRLVKTDSRYPLWRVDDTITYDTGTRRTNTLRRSIMVGDHVLVQLRPGATREGLARMARTHGAEVRKALHTPGLFVVSAAPADLDTVERLTQAFTAATNLVLHVSPDFIVHTQDTLPNDAMFGSLWNLRNTGQSGGTAGADISAVTAWDLATGSTNVIVGIIDTGVDWHHADLAANIWSNPLEPVNGLDDDGNGYIDDVRGWDFVTNTNDPMDLHGHGTHVAGTIAGVGNNALGVVGVNWAGRILPLRFLDAYGWGSTSDAIEALRYVIALRQRGINVRLTSNSWGGGGDDPALSQAIRDCEQVGVLFIAAAGNSYADNDLNPFYPASYPWSNIISVAATDNRDLLAWFSCFGKKSVDLGAPGMNILSTTPGNTYGTMSGTSMATPHVAGVAALLWSTWPDAPCSAIRQAILDGTDSIPSLAGKCATGGRLNVRKALGALPRIQHTPLTAAEDFATVYTIDASFLPTTLFDTNSLQVLWNTTGSTQDFDTLPMSFLSNSVFRARIPEQPLGSMVYYWIKAPTRDGQILRHPANAPQSMNSFKVVPTLPLLVYGSPEEVGTVFPSYDWHLYPSGFVVQASAPLYTDSTNGSRWRCTGWTGSGSTPPAGNTNAFSFTLSKASVIIWRWIRQWCLTQSSSVPEAVSATTWWDQGSTGTSVVAPLEFQQGATNYSFAFWRLDGYRQPDPTNTAVNPVQGTPMGAPHVAEAVYLPTDMDSDGDGMADWWEYYYFGSTAPGPGEDPDGDGASNLSEYKDRTDPRRADSSPSAPAIAHVPLANPQRGPAPYPLFATVTDNFTVASVKLYWSRNGSTYTSTNMSDQILPSAYQATLPSPGTNGDHFAYFISAADNAGNTATNGPWSLDVVYAVLTISPTNLPDLLLRPNGGTNVSIVIGNTGNTGLVAAISIPWAGRQDDFEAGGGGWTHSGVNDLWNLCARRSSSPSNAWYCGNPTTGLYSDSMHACLYTPPTFVGTGSRLTFRHWITSELDTQTGLPMHAWDGGIVEISTNAGGSFQQIEPVGGYPYRISGWWESPWEDETPCFAGTGAWETAVFDLAAYAGMSVVVRFHFGTDSNTDDEGWYIDDVVFAQDMAANTWISVAPTNVVLGSGQSTNLILQINATNIMTGNRSASLRVTTDAAVPRTQDMPVTLKVRSPPIPTTVTAHQFSTNGEGLVTVAAGVSDPDGDSCSLEVLWSEDNAVTWSTSRIQSAQASVGNIVLRTNIAPQFQAVLTLGTSNVITNVVTAIWDSLKSVPHVSLSTATLVRIRAWDGYFWGNAVTSMPFLVDNEPPIIPPGITSASHTLNAWSTNPVISVQWPAASDGVGAGGCSYLYGFVGSLFGISQLIPTTSTQVFSTPVVDGSNWTVTVFARDIFGNRSTPATAGPYWIDTTPPSASNAAITVAHSPYGNYVVSLSATSTWTGFSDAGAGISGYFYAPTNRSGTTNGNWSTTAAGVVTGLVADQTNRIFVWAQDGVGLIGQAVSAPVLALSPEGDWDHDGLSNLQEELAGTDASSAGSLFRISSSGSPNNPVESLFILRWTGVEGHHYSISYTETLPPTGTVWQAVPDATDIPGVSGLMTCTDRVENISMRFYRISVTSP